MSDYQASHDQLRQFIDGLHIVDTHEHLPNEADRDKRLDVLSEYLGQYFRCDLISAGLSWEGIEYVCDPAKDIMKRWKTVAPYWEAAKSTGYGRVLDITARGLYGVDGISRKTLGALNEAFLAARAKGGHYEYVLKQKSRIALSVVDQNLPCDRRFFASVLNVGPLVMPDHRNDMKVLGERVGIKVHRLEDYEQAVRRTIEHAIDKDGAVGLKSALAYRRSLLFEKVDTASAEQAFNAMFAEERSPEWRVGHHADKALQDWMMHAILRLADERGLAFQFHTGLQEGNGNIIADSNPALLTNLLLEYTNVKFDLFHMGYPYVMVLGNLAKNFRNCHIDMCWGHIISPEAARRALVEWLDAVPANKINGFGGDYCFIDPVYGHAEIARHNIASSLATKVADGSFDLDRARQIAQWVLVDNPTNLFDLGKRIKQANKPASKKAKK